MDLGLSEKRVFISGSSQGIGLSIAEAFLKEGAKVILNARNETKLAEICRHLSEKYAKGHVYYFAGDMMSKRDIISLKKYVADEFKGLDILIPNVGSGKPVAANQLDIEQWKHFLRINLLGNVQLLDAMLSLLKMGQEPAVVLISSVAAKEISGAPYAYAAAKGAVLTLSNRLAHDWAQYHIRVNTVLPGNIYFEGGRWEEIMKTSRENTMKMVEDTVAMQRFGRPDEIAPAVVFLASRKASFITASSLVIDGGQLKGI